MTNELSDAYHSAQKAIADLKYSVRAVLSLADENGLRNVDIGRTQGIYGGHIEHEGHISRTLLAIMKNEGIVEQDDKTKLWTLQNHLENKE